MVDETTRPVVPLTHDDAPLHRRLIAMRANVGLPIDGTEPMQEVLVLKSYAIADLPTASLWEGGVVYVSDETGGATLAFSDGTSWRRVQDRAVAS